MLFDEIERGTVVFSAMEHTKAIVTRDDMTEFDLRLNYCIG